MNREKKEGENIIFSQDQKFGHGTLRITSM